MNKFIKLHYWYTTARREINVSASEIVSYELCTNDDPFAKMTSVELTSGRTLFVEESPETIGVLLNGPSYLDGLPIC